MIRYLSYLVLVTIFLTGCSIGPFGNDDQSEESGTPTPTSMSTEEVMGVKEDLETITRQTLPADAEQAILRDVTGENSSGIATRNFQNQVFQLNVLADLPVPDDNSFYEAWLVRGQADDPDFDVKYAGKLSRSKGGWLLDQALGEDLRSHNGVVITEESNDDQQPETHILEGSF